MGARLTPIATELRMATEGMTGTEAVAALAAFARGAVSEFIASGQASGEYVRYVNGVPGAPEESVKLPGPIVYEFQVMPDVLPWVMDFVRESSPVRSRRYRNAWLAFVDGDPVTDYERVTDASEIVVVNPEPYARKIEINYKKAYVPSGIVHKARQMVFARWGSMVEAQIRYITLSTGYVLKSASGHARRKVDATGRSIPNVLTYPALVLNIKG